MNKTDYFTEILQIAFYFIFSRSFLLSMHKLGLCYSDVCREEISVILKLSVLALVCVVQIFGIRTSPRIFMLPWTMSRSHISLNTHLPENTFPRITFPRITFSLAPVPRLTFPQIRVTLLREGISRAKTWNKNK
jgi:hypothetical protein